MINAEDCTMEVVCQIVQSDHGYEGVIVDVNTDRTVYNTGFCGCAEDADYLMEVVILRNKWNVRASPR